jgi:hypothetical protein
MSDFVPEAETTMGVARIRPTNVRVELDELADTEVPAAVVCAHCGDADCPGCLHEQTRSGVVAVVPWERPGASAAVRLWTTARATVLEADRFFQSLPDGPLLPALGFAVTSELVASSAMALLALVPLIALAPALARHLLVDEWLTVLRFTSAAIPALALLLVLAHVAHGWALDRGARRVGARAAASRALRFGLYAAGWDLVLGPIGVVLITLKQGPVAGLSIVGASVGLPGRCARAFLWGCYRLQGKSAEPALRASYLAAIVATLVGAVAVIVALAVVMLA